MGGAGVGRSRPPSRVCAASAHPARTARLRLADPRRFLRLVEAVGRIERPLESKQQLWPVRTALQEIAVHDVAVYPQLRDREVPVKKLLGQVLRSAADLVSPDLDTVLAEHRSAVLDRDDDRLGLLDVADDAVEVRLEHGLERDLTDGLDAADIAR